MCKHTNALAAGKQFQEAALFIGISSNYVFVVILLPTVSKFTGHKFACWWLYLVAFNYFMPKVQLKHCSINCHILHGLISIIMWPWLNGYLSRFVLPTSLWGQCIRLTMADMYQKTMACSDSLL